MLFVMSTTEEVACARNSPRHETLGIACYVRRMSKFVTRTVLGTAACIVLSVTGSATSLADPDSAAAHLPERIVVAQPGLYPEGIEWDAKHRRFLISSVADGSVTSVGDDGSATAFASGEGLTSTLGTYIDTDRNRLLVTGADFAALNDAARPGEAKLGVYDATSGQRLQLIELADLLPQQRHLANDVTVDDVGNAYVTDSFTPAIYKVTPAGEATVMITDPRLASPRPAGIGLNGIQYHPGGYLLAAVAGANKLFRIPLDNPAGLTEVQLPGPISIDGITLESDGNLVVAAPFTPAVIRLASRDEWMSTQIVDIMAVAATDTTTNTAIRDGVVYALNAHFAQMDGPEPVSAFEIFRVRPETRS
jgi:sugar lactone lactonase YvrE